MDNVDKFNNHKHTGRVDSYQEKFAKMILYAVG